MPFLCKIKNKNQTLSSLVLVVREAGVEPVGLRTEEERLHVAGLGSKQAAARKVVEKPALPPTKPTPTKPAPTKPASPNSAPDEPVIITNTPEKPQTYARGCVDVTQEWFDSATPNSHEITEVTVFEQDGVVYRVDGKNVIFEPSDREREIASILERTLGGELFLMPKVNYPESVSTPDCLFRGARWDFKCLDDAKGKNAVYNRLNPAQKQASSFVIDITNSPPGKDEMLRQAREIFNSHHARGINAVIVIEHDRVIAVYERNK